nr:MAG TPA: hypothetical protein [Caudoviricetes sp.]
MKKIIHYPFIFFVYLFPQFFCIKIIINTTSASQ